MLLVVTTVNSHKDRLCSGEWWPPLLPPSRGAGFAAHLQRPASAVCGRSITVGNSQIACLVFPSRACHELHIELRTYCRRHPLFAGPTTCASGPLWPYMRSKRHLALLLKRSHRAFQPTQSLKSERSGSSLFVNPPLKFARRVLKHNSRQNVFKAVRKHAGGLRF